MNVKGHFITFEGIDGSGKSTQVRRLAEALQQRGHRIEVLRDPGGSRISEQIRSILLSNQNVEMDAMTELLLYEAARAQMVGEKIRPALQSGHLVILDRFYDSTTAYQGHGRGLNLEAVENANRIATGGLVPDLTFFIDVPWDEGRRRLSPHATDRLEGEDDAFFNRTREGYLSIARREPLRVKVIDGMADADTIAERILIETLKILS